MDGHRKHRIIRLLLDRDGSNCWICDLPLKYEDRERRKRRITGGAHGNTHTSTTIDHIKARVDGGSSDVDNLKLAHKICNTTRRNFDLTDGLRRACQERVLAARGIHPVAAFESQQPTVDTKES